MVSFSLSQIAVSFINFWQNIGITINFPHISMPGWLRIALTFVQNFINIVVFTIIPKIPNFDSRTQLVILSLGIPFLLDVCIMWFVNPLSQTILHILDLASAYICAYIISMVFVVRQYKVVLMAVLGVFTGTWILARFFFGIKKLCSSKEISFQQFGKDICAHFLAPLVPGIQQTHTIDQINEQLNKYSNLIQLVPKKPPVWQSILSVFAGVFFVFAGLFVGGIINFGNFRINNSTIRVFLPYLLYPVGIILFFVGILKLSDCGVNFVFKFILFCKRWGLRLLMLCLDLLYIPILTQFVSQITPSRIGCDVGYSFFVKHTPWDPFDFYITHDYKCLPCGDTFQNMSLNIPPYENMTGDEVTNLTLDYFSWTNGYGHFERDASFFATCERQCSGEKVFRLSDDHSLEFTKDVLKVNGVTGLFTIVFIMFGIPYLWYQLISKNRNFVTSLHVFGHNREDKWNNIVSRLHTTGIFLFAEYKLTNSYWSVCVLFYKFFIMLLSTVSINFLSWAIYFLPVVYLFMFILICKRRPHIFTRNIVIDAILYFLNFLSSAIPIVSLFYEVPTIWMEIFSLALVIIPIASVVIFFIQSVASRQTDDDPTLPVQFTDEQLEDRAERIRKRKSSKRRRRKKAEREERRRKRIAAGLPPDDDSEEERRKKKSSKKTTNDKKKDTKEGKKAIDDYSYSDYSYSDNPPYNSGPVNPPPIPINTMPQGVPSPQPGYPQPVNAAGYPGYPVYPGYPGYPGYPAGQPGQPVQPAMYTATSREDGYANIQLNENQEIDDDDYLPEDIIKIKVSDLMPLNQTVPENEEYAKKEFDVNRIVLANRMTEMYSMLDVIIDGSTIKKLTSFLTVSVIFAAFAFGWFTATIGSPGMNGPVPCMDYGSFINITLP